MSGLPQRRNPISGGPLFDLGRHILAKGFGQGVVEYKELAAALVDRGVIAPAYRDTLGAMPAYRNRLTHFSDEVAARELYEIATTRLGDLEALLDSILAWLRSHPELLDKSV